MRIIILSVFTLSPLFCVGTFMLKQLTKNILVALGKATKHKHETPTDKTKMEAHQNWWFVDVFTFRRKHFQVWYKFRRRKKMGESYFSFCALFEHQSSEKKPCTFPSSNQMWYFYTTGKSNFFLSNRGGIGISCAKWPFAWGFSCHISWSNLRSSQGLRLRSGGIACCMACMARKFKKWRLIMNLSWVQLRFAVATCF